MVCKSPGGFQPQLDSTFRVLMDKPVLQKPGEQVVVTKPAALFVKRNEEQIHLLYGFKQLPAAGLPGDSHANGRVHTRQD
nr:hypothetical protein [Paenibacillus yonginensis]